MKVSVAWLREYVDLPELSALELERALVKVGLEVEGISDLGSTVEGPLVVGRVESFEPVPKVKKPIRYCQVDVGEAHGGVRGIICGAQNFDPGDLVVVALPGAVLPGGFEIAARKTYGQISNGMICSGRELGVSDDHAGIIVLEPGTAEPGTEARPLVGLDEVLIELAITPDRGYCFSARGIARELSHSLGLPFRDPALSVEPTPGTPEPAYPVAVVDPLGCDRFAARVVRGIDPSARAPEWMRKRLAVAGVRSINLAVDITNYLMMELGQPMHAFDLNLIRGPLVVRRANAGEKLTTLDGVARTLDPEDMVICDDTGPISLAAVMGGETSEVQPSTVDILFEAAHWDPVMVARTARRHKLPSEASKRWERGVDRELCLVGLEKAVRLLVQYGGGTPGTELLDFDTRPTRRQVQLDAALPSRVAGVDYSRERVTELLQEIGADVVADGDRLTVTPPTWRPDLTDPADLVEEVIRLDGYDKVPSVLPIAPPGNGWTATQRRRTSVGRALAEAGFVEVLTYPFVGESALDALGIPADDPRRAQVRLANPISEEEPALRTTLLPPLLGALRRNLGRGHRDVALYEIGPVFHPGNGATPPALGVDRRPTDEELALAQAVVPAQPWHVAAVLAGDAEPAGWWGAGRPVSWADAVDAARLVVETAGAEPVVRAGTNPPWHPGRCAEIVVGGKVIGHAGELHPAVCAALDLPPRTCATELVLDDVPLPGIVVTPTVSSYPPALIDVALVVDAATPAAEVQRALTDGAGELLEAVRLFDVYTGAQVGQGRKSLAYKLTFRAGDRTLTVDEAVAARDAAVTVARERLGAALRGA
ncbi:phenylalanine--tRNA ligase beta subunit [Virgisporangium aliadipatigenens]|uniref:Phenylalanine--tRNA ligase beta subunit n=1 Tax=Virgisporangium aliadipatigenens TaxID=741659 RepID=A0A8J3YTE8_9ACTN|nr:phenylalanine--tRNA ligase subunit beta [Virgisporangium aliadipatigenens]GIJ51544.1 phenylalanine--tRNA ligase beta subunit [Virgisporangium aliadipatigenens]